jgi:dienelactone hydrolase
MAAVLASYEQVRAGFEPNGARFAAHVSFYGPCVVRFERVQTTGAPVAVMLGAEDANVPVERCREIVGDLERGGSRVELAVYAGAMHQWDSPWAREPRRMDLNLSACRFRVEEDGAITNLNTGLAMSGWLTRRITLAGCVDSSGYLIGRNEEVMRRADADLLRFLDRALR